MSNKVKLFRITTVPLSLEKLLEHQLRFMQNYFAVTAISSDPSRLKKVAEKEGVNFFSLTLTRQITPYKDLKALWKLFFYLKREKPFIVHSHTPKAGVVAMVASKLAGVPYRLHTVAGLPLLEVTGLKRGLLDFIERITYKCATKIYPNSNGLKDIIIQQKFCRSNKLKVIGCGSSNGIDTSYFERSMISENQRHGLKEKLGISSEDFVFIFVGRLVGDKGINELTFAFDTLSKTHKSVKLLLIGPLESELDPLEKATLDLINKHKDIISVGFQNDVRPYFAISDVLTFPSYREGFPNVVLQAGSMGLPSIVSNINGCNEIIEEGENGLVIPVKDIDALRLAMKALLLNKELLETMAGKARKRIMDRYEQHVVWNLILEEYMCYLQKDVSNIP